MWCCPKKCTLFPVTGEDVCDKIVCEKCLGQNNCYCQCTTHMSYVKWCCNKKCFPYFEETVKKNNCCQCNPIKLCKCQCNTLMNQ